MRRTTWLVGAVLLTLLGCDDDDEPSTPSDAGAALDSGVVPDAGQAPDAAAGDAATAETFTALYEDIFQDNGCPGCHLSTSHPSKLSLATRDEAYDGLVNEEAAGLECADSGATRVIPGDADGSLLIHKLEGEDASGEDVCGARMPLGLPPLDQDEIDRIRAWIDAGAEDN